MSEIKKVSIIGCGWMGLPLAEALVENGYAVKGSTTHQAKVEAIQKAGIQPFVLNLNPNLEGENQDEFFNADVLIINIPPKIAMNGLDFHEKQISSLLPFIEKSSIQKVIFTSSTSVYPALNRVVVEEDANETAHPVLMKAEVVLKNSTQELVILRLAGLMGYDRMPAKYFAGKKGLTIGEIPVNYVHQDDVVAIILKAIQQNLGAGIYNVVAPEHPIRKAIYFKNCVDFKLERPEFVAAEPQSFKVVNGNKLMQVLDYQYVYPNPLDFKYT